MNVLGINAAYHESSACLVQDGRIVTAAEEERFIRVKHAKASRVDNPEVLALATPIAFELLQELIPNSFTAPGVKATSHYVPHN